MFVMMLFGDCQVALERVQVTFFIKRIKRNLVPQMSPSESLGVSRWRAVLSTYQQGLCF